MSEQSIAADQLRLLIERIERLEEEKKGIADDIKDVYGEAKATGYDVKTVRKVVALRKMEPHARQESDALLATYLAALGMEHGGFDYAPRGAVSAPTPSPVPHEEDAGLYPRAVTLVRDNGKASCSWLQRQMRIGYNQASRLIERMEGEGIVSAPNHIGARIVLQAAPAPEAVPA